MRRKIFVALILLILFARESWASFSCDVTVDGYSVCEMDLQDFNGITPVPSLSNAGQARIYFDLTDMKLKCSEDGGAYVDCVGGGGGTGDVTDVGDCSGGACFKSGGTGTSLYFQNASSGSVTLKTVTGALGTRNVLLPAADGTLAVSATAPVTLSAAGDIGLTVAKDLVTTAPLAGGTDNILPGADSDVTLSIADAVADGSTKGAAAFAAADFNSASGVISIDYSSGQSATTTIKGFLTAFATTAEVNTGTEITKAVTPDALAGSVFGVKGVIIPITTGLDQAATTGDGKNCFTIPIELNGMNLVSVGAHVYTNSSSGLPTFQIRNATDTQDMLSTALTIDANEPDSSTAATAAVIDATKDDVVTADVICVDKDVAGTGEKGDEIRLGFQLP